jgi:hypothetical protein
MKDPLTSYFHPSINLKIQPVCKSATDRPGLLDFTFIALAKDMKAYISIEDDPHGRLLQRNLNLIFSALTGWM